MSNVKRLLICSPCHALRGGVETLISDLARELPRRGWDALLALGEGSRFNKVQAYKNVHGDVPIVAVDGTRGTRQSRIESLAKVVRKTKPDVVLSARVLDALEVVARMKARGGPRLALAIRGFEPAYFHDARLYRENIDLCVVSGELPAAACREWVGIEGERVVNLPIGVHPPESAVGARTVTGTLRIGYVGRLAQQDKRVLDLLQLCGELAESGLRYRLDVVGAGPEEEKLRAGLAGLVASGTVVFHGWKERTELYGNIYPELDCIVNFSGAEGVVVTPREAMLHGVAPVLSMCLGLTSEGLLVDGVNCLTFPVGDIRAAAGALERLAKEPGLLERLSSNAMRAQSGKYLFEGAMDAWAGALDRCVSMPPVMGRPPRLPKRPGSRLAGLGLSPWMAQRLRNALGKRWVHTDPGGEWPGRSGLMTEETWREITRFAEQYETDPGKGNVSNETESRGAGS